MKLSELRCVSRSDLEAWLALWRLQPARHRREPAAQFCGDCTTAYMAAMVDAGNCVLAEQAAIYGRRARLPTFSLAARDRTKDAP